MMRKPYPSPNFDDPVEYLTPPLRGQVASSENASNPATLSVSLTTTIVISLEKPEPGFGKRNSDGRDD
ncbi:hypothetical protein AKG11_32400 [Shinella sp. SUS2]|uniref:hypothetical protein n=1 Tax=unclassified Shinella TaxID=2643062 RepID=UPI00067F9E57|nr:MULTISPECIES: hypothetical protein [unclassified Shinella]KNY12878.1 hypothetical protein AKG11_32400 [Shinella sp. SUS2]KOC71611.1 hypothetical protein AKG10_32060 [Shinella sp. GWS1]